MTEMFIQEGSLLGGVIKIILNAGALYGVAHFMKNVTFDRFKDAIIVALILAILNVTLVPILSFFTYPIRVITLGMFSLVISAAMLFVAAHFVDGFKIKNFWGAFTLAILVAILNSVLHTIYF